MALDGARTALRRAVLWARVLRASRFAALALLADIVLALHFLRVVHQRVSVRALVRVAEALMF